MYGVVLMMALSQSTDLPDFGRRGGCHGCYGGCYGGGWGGCYGGGYGGCYGGGWGGCYGGGWGGCYGGFGMGGYGGCYRSGFGYGGCGGGFGYGGGFATCYGGGFGYGGCSGSGLISGGCYGSGYGGGLISGGCYGGGLGVGGIGGGFMAPIGTGIQGGAIQGGTIQGGGIQGEPLPTPKDGKHSQAPAPATIVVSLPENAALTVDDNPTTSTSSSRTFISPELPQGKDFHYNLKATVIRDGKPVVVEKRITVRAGDTIPVTLTLPETGAAQR